MSPNARLPDPVSGETPEFEPKVWILLGNRVGDDNQLRALAEGLGWPFEEKTLRFNRLRHLRFLRDERLLHLTDDARSSLIPPWPDLVIGLGYESIPVARFVRRQSGGRTRIVQLGNPRTDIADLDLVIATPQYSLPVAPNLLEIPFPIGNPAQGVTATAEEEGWFEAMPHPRRLVAVGGSTRQWEIDAAELERAVQCLKADQTKSGGSVIAVTSRRTPPRVTRLLEELLSGKSQACVSQFPRFAVLLAECDALYVTADSVSMLAETILTGKPVGMIPIRRSRRGLLGHVLRRLGVPLKSKADLSRFWSYLASHKLVGSVAAPIASTAAETTQLAVKAVQNVVQSRPGPKIWALLGAHQGDNNQVLALAEAMALPFERKLLNYNRWRHLGPSLLGASFRSLTRSSRAALSGDLPDLTISTGHRSVAPVQLLRERSGGTVRSIHVGYPRISPEKFELVIATPEYPIHEHPNLLRIPFALTRKAAPEGLDADFWQGHPAPRRLLIIGGPSLYWQLDPEAVWKALTLMVEKTKAKGGSVIVIGSPRTQRHLLAEAERRVRNLAPPASYVPVGGQPSYREVLEQADTITVTADSVAMVSDALATGKPIGLIPIRPTRMGRVVMAAMDRLRPAEPLRPRDLRSFWRVLQHRGFVGTPAEPKSVSLPDLNRLAAVRARAILDKDEFSSAKSSSAQ
jgi:hypothetical protein